MPVLGFIHHHKFKKYQRRTAVSHVHIWLGRFLVLLGIVNGGLGLKQAGASHDVKVGYAIIAAIAGTIWLFFSIFGEVKRNREQRRREEDRRALAAAAAAGAGGGGMMMMNRGMSVRSSQISDRASTGGGTRRVSEETLSDNTGHDANNKNVGHDAVSEISSRK